MSQPVQIKDESVLQSATILKIVPKPSDRNHTAPTSWAWHDDRGDRRLCLCGQEHGIKGPAEAT